MTAQAEWEMQSYDGKGTTSTRTRIKAFMLKIDHLPDELKRIVSNQEEIKKEVKKTNSIAKTWANMLRFGAKDLRD